MTKGATNYAQSNINGLSCVRESYPTKGMSKEGILVLLQYWRIGTQKGYETYINRLVQFCFRRKLLFWLRDNVYKTLLNRHSQGVQVS